MKRLIVLILVLALVIPTGSILVTAQGDDPFEGMTPEELFPTAIDDQERQSAMEALLAANLPDARDRFEGQTLTIGVLASGTRGVISGAPYFWRNAFEAVTGAKLEIIEIPFEQMLTTLTVDFSTNQNTYDAIINASWFYGDYISNDWIIPIDDYIGAEGYPMWEPEKVAAPLQQLLKWGDSWYGVVNDGDTQMFYYRRDILEDPEWQAAYEEETGEPMPVPPQTWQQMLKVAQFFNGKDWNGDGDPDDGVSLHLKVGGQGFFHYMALSAPFSITPAEGGDPTAVTKYDNIYWFDPDDMTPVINSPGHVAALEFLQQLAATGSPSQFGWELGEAWDNFLNGNAVMLYSWGDVGSLAQDPNASTIKGKLGGSRILCSEDWYDRETGEFVHNAENSNCVGNLVGASWHGVISSASDVPDLAYYFLAMQAAPPILFWNVVYGWTGVDPSSTPHLFPPAGEASVDDYVAAGYDAGDVESYITGYGDNLFTFPTSQTYLRIPGTPEYWNILDIRLAEAMIGELSAQEALDEVASEWEDITDDIGRDYLLPIYQESIGYAPSE
ncbi:MAG TPA: extracellular solute-binding protein [Aggregatilinea sp.]|uniref:extracellular solute-binding protein n=1 Tax=Aggregatilinea sp. TaxID=2806333 RepID=UPI002BB2B663|nr:extracellular solute-binding protein [Aggregatilinea sp.]HML21492.1 extracellular solute-binding protein [Aggregatilinea sp.]